MFIVYILYSANYGKTYVGFTNDLERRLREHNVTEGSGYTLRYRPWALIYKEEYGAKAEAMKREKFLKTGVGREKTHCWDLSWCGAGSNRRHKDFHLYGSRIFPDGAISPAFRNFLYLFKLHSTNLTVMKTPHRHTLSISILLLLCQLMGFSQVNKPTFWTKNYGGSLSDNAAGIVATPDGGHILCGTTKSNNFDVSGLHGTENDIWVVKINKTGTIEWQKTYANTFDEIANSIIRTSDGGYAICGSTNMYTSYANAFVIKITSTGVLQWQKQFGGSSSDRGWQIAETTDGGFVVTGEMIGPADQDFAGQTQRGDYDLFVTKLSSSGSVLWSRLYGGSWNERGFFIKQLSDGNLLVGGSSRSQDGDVVGNHNLFDAADFWILKLSNTGNIIWAKCYGSSGDEIPYSGFEKNGRYYLIGTTMNLSRTGDGDVSGTIDAYDMWMVVLDTAGNLVRQKCIGGTSSVDMGIDIAPTLDNNLVITGRTQSNDTYVSGNKGLTDVAIIKVDTLGALLWSKLYGSTDYDYGVAISVNADSTYTVASTVQKANGDVKAVYGQTDLWAVSHADTALYPDLYTKITGNTQHYVGNKIKYQLIFGRYTRVINADTITLQFLKDSRLTLVSTSRPVNMVKGDTLIWKFAKNSFPRKDTIGLEFSMNSNGPFMPNTFVVKTLISPFTDELFQTNNVDQLRVKIRYQNAAIISPSITVTSVPVTGVRANVDYTINYSYTSHLDTTRGVVKVIKDSKTDFVSSVPSFTTMVGDTLTWNFLTTIMYPYSSIKLTLKVKDTPHVQIGSQLYTQATLQFNTIDTSVLRRTHNLVQQVGYNCVTASTTNTNLPAPHGIQWLRIFGGTGDDFISSVAAVSDTTFVGGYSSYSMDGDAAGVTETTNGFVIKYASDGRQLWKTRIGGENSDQLSAVASAGNGSVLAIGYTNSMTGTFSSNHGEYDLFLTKIDSAGRVVWQKLIGGWGAELFPTIRRISDTRFVVVARTNSRNGDVINTQSSSGLLPWLFVIDQNGTILSQKVYSDTLFPVFRDVQPTLDKGFILGGFGYSSTGAWAARLVKTDSTGTIKFSKDYTNYDHDQEIYSIAVNADSSFTFTGMSSPTSGQNSCLGDHGQSDVIVAKVSSSGAVLWQKFYGSSRVDFGKHILKMQGGGYLITAEAAAKNGNVTQAFDSAGNTSDVWLVKLNENGDLVWQRSVGGNKAERAWQSIQLQNNDIIVVGFTESQNNGDIRGSKGGIDAMMFKLSGTNFITGHVFADKNANHIMDAGEPFLSDGLVISSKGSQASSSAIVNGMYANSIDSGLYVTRPSISSPYYTPFPKSDTINADQYFKTFTSNFAMIPINGIKDLRITVLPLRTPRAGQQGQYKIIYENAGTEVVNNSSITITKDQRTTFVSSSVPFTSMANNTFRWDITSVPPMEKREILLTLSIQSTPSVNAGDTLRLSAKADPLSGDTTPVNNNFLLKEAVVNNLVSNDKMETHGSSYPAQSLSAGEYLNYIVRFQNAGPDTAFRVLVIDTLDAKLDWNSLEVISNSHAYTMSVKNGRVVEWKFDPISLPGLNQNTLGSQGHVAFRIKPKANLLERDTISNKASIYFGFNLPIVTNTQRTFVDNGLSICAGGSVTYTSGISAGSSYQWQVDNGQGYTNVSDNTTYTGSNTETLRLNTPSTSLAGSKYRCLVTTGQGVIKSAEFQLRFSIVWTGAVDNNWDNPNNWNCGIVPDPNMEVVIKTGTVNVNSNTTIRSLHVQSGVQILIKSPFSLNVLK
jgi:uncharacterized repeat protein (TIGR01451 family)